MLQLDPRYHKILDTHITDWLKREFPKRKLAVMRNAFVAPAVWEIVEILKPGTVKEFVIIGDSLDKFTKDKARDLRSFLRQTPDDAKAIRKSVLQADQNHAQEAHDDAQQTADYYKHFRRRLRDDTPNLKVLAGESDKIT